MKLNRTMQSMSMIHWWVDDSYNTNTDCRGHVGAMMSPGHGEVKSLSKKQKLNMRSSTYGKLVGTDDTMGSILWGK